MKYQVNLNGKTYEVEVNKGQAILVDEYNSVAPAPTPVSVATPSPAPTTVSAPIVSTNKSKTVSAPIAGTVLSIKAQAGQAVKKGQVVLIIEAMKMENEIVSPNDGKIANLYVSKGSVVSNGTQLFDLE